jgi:hypothetical protein
MAQKKAGKGKKKASKKAGRKTTRSSAKSLKKKPAKTAVKRRTAKKAVKKKITKAPARKAVRRKPAARKAVKGAARTPRAAKPPAAPRPLGEGDWKSDQKYTESLQEWGASHDAQALAHEAEADLLPDLRESDDADVADSSARGVERMEESDEEW